MKPHRNRHDQHPQTALRAKGGLLDPRTQRGKDTSRNVRTNSWLGQAELRRPNCSSELTLLLALLRFSSDFDSAAIRIYDGRGDGKPLHTLTALHRSSVHLMAVSPRPRPIV